MNANDSDEDDDVDDGKGEEIRYKLVIQQQ